jgi:tetratricopeptide (TPR) repeat protein
MSNHFFKNCIVKCCTSLCFWIFATFSNAQVSAPVALAINYREEAGNLYEANKYDLLVVVAKKWVETQANDPMAHLFLGAGLRESRPEEALQSLQAAQKLGQRSPLLMYELGQVYRNLKRKEESLVYFRRALELNPKSAHYTSQVGVALTFVGKHKESLHYLKRAIEMGDNSLITQANYGLVAYKAVEPELSQRELTAVLKQDPAYEAAALTLGMVYFEEENYRKAIEIYSITLEKLSGKSAGLLNNLSNAQRHAGLFSEAKESANKAIALNSKYSFAYLNLSKALIKLKLYDEARKVLAQTVDLDPSDAAPWLALAHLEHLEKNDAARDKAMQHAEALDPEETKLMRESKYAMD